MKTIIFFLLISFSGYSQTVKTDVHGNYFQDSVLTAKATGKVFTDSKGAVYPVYISAKGKLFVIRTSKKTGNKYNYYLKV